MHVLRSGVHILRVHAEVLSASGMKVQVVDVEEQM